MEEYYQKVIQLQEKLRQSEEERLRLEMKFNEMLQMLKEEEEAHFKKLRNKYKQFLEEDIRRQQRNDKILEALDRIENRTVMWETKTEKFKYFRNQYKQSLKNARQSRWEIEETLMCPRNNKFPVDCRAVFEGGENFGAEDDILKTSTKNFSSQNFKDNVLEKGDNKNFSPENKYSQLGNINSIYWKNSNNIEKIDLEKAHNLSGELDSTQLKTTKDMENSRKQCNKEPIQDSEKYNDYNFGTTYSTGNNDDLDEKKTLNFNKLVPHHQQFYYNKGHTTDNSQNLIAQSIKPSADQVHNELEQLLKQHKNETSIMNHLHVQKTSDEQLLKKLPVEDQNCYLQLSDLPTSNNDSCVKSLKNDPAIHQEHIVKENVDKEKMSDINTNVSELLSNNSTSLPDAVNLVKSKPPYQQIQRRLSIMAQSDSYEASLTNQNKYNLPQVINNQENKTEDRCSNLEQDQTCETQIKQNSDEHSNEQHNISNSTVQHQLNMNEQVSEQQFVAHEPYATITSQKEQNHIDEQSVAQYNCDQYSQQHFGDHGQTIQQCYDENGQLLQQYNQNDQFLSHYDTSEQYDVNGKLLLQGNENTESSFHFDENGQKYNETNQPLQQFYNENNQELQQYYEEGTMQQYEKPGQPVLEYDQNEQLTMQYDKHDQQYSQYDEHSLPQNDSNLEFIVQYDENGHPIPQCDVNDQLSAHYDENEQPYQEYYDENGQPIPYYSGGGFEQRCNEASASVSQDYNDRPYVQHQNLEHQGQPYTEYNNKVMEILDTDTESANQNSKVSNDSDFNISTY